MIKKVEIEGYRLLDGFQADLGDLTVVIGANGSGKSTLLESLQVISQCTSYPVNEVLLWHGGAGSVVSASKPGRRFGWSVSFDRTEDKGLWGSLPIRSGLELVYEVEFTLDSHWKAVPASEILRYAKPFPDHKRPFKFLELSGGRRKIFDVSQRQLTDPDLFSTDTSSAETREDIGLLDSELGREPAEATAKGPSLLLSEARLFENYPVASYVRVLFASFAFYPGVRVDLGAPARQPSQISPRPVLLPGGDNLACVLHEIFTRIDARESAEEVRGFLRSAYPWVDDVVAETAYGLPGAVTLRVRESGMQRDMNSWDLSDGMVRFLCLQAALLNPSLPPLVVMDEPEAGLHPRLLPIVADIIKTGAERTQVLVTTHSPELVQCFDLDHIAVMAREETRAEWYRPGTRQSLRRMLEAVEGDTLADLHRSGELEAMP